MATDSGHNSKSQTHSGLLKCDSRPFVTAEPAHHDRVESPPRSRESDIQAVGNSSSGHVRHSPQHASSPVHVSSSEASSPGDRCLVTGLAGEVDVHVSIVSPAHPWWPSPPRLWIREVSSLFVGSRIMVAPEPVLGDALPYLSNSGIIRNVI